MTNRWKVTAAAVLAAAGIAIVAASPFKNPKVVQALNLTPQQQQKLDDLSYQHQIDSANLRRDMQVKRLDLERELGKDNPDPAVLDKLIDEQSSLRARAGKARVQQMLAVKKVLSPDQWSKAKELWRERRAERMGNHGGRNFGGHGRGAGQGRGQGRGQGQGFGGPGQGGPGPGPDAPGPGAGG